MNDNRNSSALFRRADQLERWIQSSTNKQTSETKRPTRIKFSRETIFLAACKSNDKEEIKDLVHSGVDVNTGNTDGLTALHQACIDGNLDMVEYLISIGAALNVADSEGWTPLHATASCGFVSVARYLIEMGANNSAVNYDGDLPIDTAVGDEMIQLLQNDIDEKGIDVDECRAQEKNKLMQDVEIWAKNGIHEMDNNSIGGATPLHVAAAKGYLEVVSGLLKRCKVNVDAIDSEGWTPLHAAAHFNQRQVAEILIQHGADMEIVNAAGLNCIEVADSELVQWLQQKMSVYLAAVQTNKAIMANKRPPPALREPLHNKLKRVERGNTDLTQEDIKITETPKPDPVHEITIGQRPEICTPPPATRTSEIIEKNSIDDTISWKNIPKIRKNTAITGSNESFTSGREIIADSNVSIRRRPSANDSDKESMRVVPTEDVLSPQSVQSPTISSSGAITNQQSNVSSPQQQSAAVKLSPGNIFKNFFKSFVPPVRDDESESQRKAHAKRARETRRSTQGVTLDELKSAEQLVKVKKTGSSNGTPPSQTPTARSNDTSTDKNERVGEVETSNCVAVTLPLSNHTTITATATIATGGNERRPSWRLRVDAGSKFALEDATKPTALSGDPTDESTLPKVGTTVLSRRSPTTVNSVSAVLPSTTAATIPMESAKTTSIYASSNKVSVNTSSPENLQTTSSNTISKLPATLANTTDATFTLSLPRQISSETVENKIRTGDKAADDKDQSLDQSRAPSTKNIVRRRRLKRRSTGVNQVDIDDVPCTPNGDSEQSGTDVDEGTGVGVNHAGDGLDNAADENLDYKALWQASTAEVKVLRAELRDAKSVIETLNQMNQNPMSEIEKREKRAMERKLSEMEEELKALQLENKKLADENSALIRVVAKLSK